MLELGHSYGLTVVKQVEFGVYLDAKNLGEILLPSRVVPDGTQAGDNLNVFIYLDSEDRPVATTKQPYAEVGQFAYLQVVDTTVYGAFVDWGLDKQLLIPFAEQHVKMESGKSYLVYIYVSPRDDRIVASSKIDKFLENDIPVDFRVNEPVDLIIANSTDLGFKAIVNHRHWGVLYKEDVFQRLSFGQSVQGFIRQVRPDGKIDLTLNGGSRSHDKNMKTIIVYLKKHKGYSTLNDKSDPAIIAKELQMSKAAFKRAIGNLLKKKELIIEKKGIRLL